MNETPREANASALETFVNSRRQFFENAAKLLGIGAAAFSLNAQSSTPTDIDILNYALTLENLEAAFYNQGLRQFSNTDFARGTFYTGLGENVGGDVFAYLTLIRDHENNHVRTLTSVIRSLGGTPVAPCTYNFNVTGVDSFVSTAAVLENTGVMAYDGALNMIQNPALKQAGATIATVEARHASYLNLLNGTSPFPDAFDVAKSMADILKAAGPFIGSCPAATTGGAQ